MPPADWPTWVFWIIGFGVVSTSLLAITALLVKTGRGMKTAGTWIAGIVRAEVTEIVDARTAPLLAQLTSSNSGSLREQVNATRELADQLAGWAARHDPEGWGHEHPTDTESP